MKKQLDLDTYIELALITKRKEEYMKSDILHSAMGLITEVGELVDSYKRNIFYNKELDLVNIKEELGDILWYMAIGFNAIGEKFPAVERAVITQYSPSVTFILGKLVAFSSQIGSSVLTSEYYEETNAEDNKEYLQYNLPQLLGFLNVLAGHIGTSLPEIAYINIEKLAKRYPNGFSEFHALNRDTVNELNHIEA